MLFSSYEVHRFEFMWQLREEGFAFDQTNTNRMKQTK